MFIKDYHAAFTTKDVLNTLKTIEEEHGTDIRIRLATIIVVDGHYDKDIVFRLGEQDNALICDIYGCYYTNETPFELHHSVIGMGKESTINNLIDCLETVASRVSEPDILCHVVPFKNGEENMIQVCIVDDQNNPDHRYIQIRMFRKDV